MIDFLNKNVLCEPPFSITSRDLFIVGAHNRTSRPALCCIPRCCRCRRGSWCRRCWTWVICVVLITLRSNIGCLMLYTVTQYGHISSNHGHPLDVLKTLAGLIYNCLVEVPLSILYVYLCQTEGLPHLVGFRWTFRNPGRWGTRGCRGRKCRCRKPLLPGGRCRLPQRRYWPGEVDFSWPDCRSRCTIICSPIS